ncbi:hypothetical protein [Methanospirillum sp.]
MSEQCDQSEDTEISIYCSDGETVSIPNSSLVLLCRDVLAKGHSFRFCAPGFSMTPFIRNRDIITLISSTKDSCMIGKVVGFLRPGTNQFVVHRIVAVKKDGFLIRGDNCSEEDGLIPYDAILGEVSRVEHNGRVFPVGLGTERVIIALLSRFGLLQYLFFPVGCFICIIRKVL